MSTNDKIKEIIRRLIRKEMEEASITGNLDGGAGPPKTPYMFQSKPKSKKDKKKEKAITTAGGYTKVNEVSLNPLIFSPGWEKNFKGYNEKELKVIVKLVNMSNGIAPVIKMSKKKDFKSFIKKAAQKGLHESLNEGQYHNYRNDESMTAKQKIGLSMREVRDKLNELDKLVKINVRLKNELNVDSKTYWKRTHAAMKKISERLVKLANKVGQLY